jgi:hypothetical protein
MHLPPASVLLVVNAPVSPQALRHTSPGIWQPPFVVPGNTWLLKMNRSITFPVTYSFP